MFSKNLKIALLAGAALIVALQVIRCGGGGDGDSPSTRVLEPISYTGVTTPAAISLANTPTLVTNVLYGGAANVTDIPSGVTITQPSAQPASSSIGADPFLDLFRSSLDNVVGSATQGYTIPAAVVYNNEITYCESGHYVVNGSLDDITGLGTLTFDYYNCLDNGVTLDGMMHFHVHYISYDQFNFTMEFVLMTMMSPEHNVSMSGTVQSDNTLYGNKLNDRETMNYVERANSTGRMFKYENFVMTLVTNDVYSPSMGGSISYSGVPVATMYDSDHGSYSVETPAALQFSSTYLSHPDLGGQLIVTGAQSGFQLTVESQRHVKLELDLDGAAGYEVVRYVLWSELDNFTTLNLTDSDGDGMHDSWENLFGLNPMIDDAAEDPDDDELTNLEEYEQGYDPSSSFSPGV